ncbi:hypothetical protein MVEN_02399800 [Mycena venus]|uniref:Uncharacterized protein n=1 Tax=Mycena venus TaxID=2733690 RepID=A0A8H6X297_9AGAR|nr:hypothetical protein MVEN_02399800 [Mycena venus]
MPFRSLASLYNLVCGLSLLQIALGGWMFYNFGFEEAGGKSQVSLILAGLYTLLLFFLLRIFQRRPEHKMSRVEGHMQVLAFAGCFHFFADVIVLVGLFPRGPTTELPPCVTRLALSMLLPLLNCAIILYAARRLYLRSRAIHGKEMVPPPPPPPVKLVPAWKLGSVDELEARYSKLAPIAI